ncbi:HesA/MoeB/ThiF family protein [Flavobacteriaceae bacterium AH-315-B10]|nr:HesA/MoeB/ThiF family protein [Flavobacteriaceae bacterium AH-315-B10]
MNRYNRHIILSEIGQKGQDKLNNAKVLVIGAGGLGCPVLQYLTAAGIGTIGIIDFDIVTESNLQRQVLFGSSSLEKNKAIAAKERLMDLNNTIKINTYPEKLTHKNALELFKDYDIIVDGTDNFATRYLINDASIITNKPLVYGAIYKFEGQVAVFNFQNGSSYRCLFPTPPKEGAIPNCSEIGVLGVLPGIIGSMQANEVIKIILGLGNILSGKLFCYNTLTTETSTIIINRNTSEINKVLSKKEDFQNTTEEINCDFQVPEISIEEAFKKKNVQFIDVRESSELPKVEALNPIYIPLSELENNLEQIDLEKEKMIFCQAGIRSKKAVSILQKHNINNCYSVKEGALGILDYLTQLQKQH